MATAQNEVHVSLKLLVNKENNKVIFAEAGKDFVDVLFSFLTMPLGTIARLVKKNSDIGAVEFGCLSSLYESVKSLEKYLRTETRKEMLLQPTNSSEDYCRSMKLNIDDTVPTKYFMCTNFSNCKHCLLSTSHCEKCECGKLMARSVDFRNDKVYKGFVNDITTFIVTDDLVIIPNSMYTCIIILQQFGVKCSSCVQEMTVNIIKKEVLDLLKCSILTKSTLTNLFLLKKPLFQTLSFSPPIVENSSTIQIKIKLVMRKSDGKILFAEGEEDFADFLLSFLTFPLGGVLRMLQGYSSLGSVDGLYNSAVSLHENKYLISKDVKNRLIDPVLAPQFNLSMQMFPIYDQQVLQYSHCYYEYPSLIESINGGRFYIANHPFGVGKYYKSFTFVDLKSSSGNLKGYYAKGPAVYMVTDDLVLAPLISPTSCLSLIDRLKTPLHDLKLKVVTIGIKEGLSILKASLTSRSALTNGLCHLLTEVVEQKRHIITSKEGIMEDEN